VAKRNGNHDEEVERARRHRKERGLSSYYPIGTILQRDVGIVYVIDISVIRAFSIPKQELGNQKI
jgi:hypothetical protein